MSPHNIISEIDGLGDKTAKKLIWNARNALGMTEFITANVNSRYLFHFVEFLKENVEKKKFMKKITSFVPMLEKKIDLDIIYITRRILTPIEFFSPNMNSSDFDKNLFGYIFKIDVFRKLKEEEIINLKNL